MKYLFKQLFGTEMCTLNSDRIIQPCSRFAWVTAWVLFVGCNPIYYAPNSHNVPLLTEAAETNLTVAGNADQVEFQGAYAFSDNFALQANGGLFIPQDDKNGNGGSGRFLEMGGGYLHPVDNNWVFEVYGLAGYGSVENHFRAGSPGPMAPTTGDISASLFRWGVQPNFGYKSPYFIAAISTRLIHLNYHNIEGNLVSENVDQVAFLSEHNTYFLAEPALTLRGGFEKVKLQLQLGVSYNITDSKFSQETNLMTIGLNFAF